MRKLSFVTITFLFLATFSWGQTGQQFCQFTTDGSSGACISVAGQQACSINGGQSISACPGGVSVGTGIDRITIILPSEVEKDGSAPLMATISGADGAISVNGLNGPIAWFVEGNNSQGTMISSSGSLMVAADETAAQLFIRAVSKATGDADTATVRIVDATGGGTDSTFVPVDTIIANFPQEVTQGHVMPLANFGTILPQNATNRQIQWTASGATIASDSMVIFDQISPTGMTVITATIRNGLCASGAGTTSCDYIETWPVRVTPGGGGTDSTFVAVTGISGVNIPTQVALNGTLSLANAGVIPSTATNRDIAWEVQGAAYNLNARQITFDKPDTVIITATVIGGTSCAAGSADGTTGSANCNFTRTWMVIVNADIELPTFIAVTGVAGANIPTQATVGDAFIFGNARVQPTNATNSQIQWTAEGATINANGTGVSFGQAGNATITATVRNGLCNPEGTTSGTQSCDYTRSWQVAVATVTQGPEFVAVQSIAANFPQFVTRDEAFFLGSERALPTNATNRGPIQWSVQGATYHADFGLIEFDQAGRATITATIANGATATTGYTQVWEVMVAQPMLYTVTLNAGNITDASSEFEAGELVSIIANAAPAGQEFGRWRVTSKGKPVTLENVNLNSSTLSFVMPKMDLEIRVVYRTVAAPPSYEVAVSGGTGSGSFAAGADVTVRPSNIPSGFVFGYWDIFPAGVLSIDNTDSTLSFKMPQTDITIRAVVSRVVQSTGRTVAIADIVQNADVSGWVPTTVGSSTIEATSDESGGITITASVSEDGFAAIESDVSPNASRSDSISISYSSSNTWRLYLDIPGIPHVEGYFVTLPATGGNPASRMSALARNAPSGDGSINFTLADFKNEFGVSISVDLAELVTGMSFAPETSGSETEASISISSLDVYMSENIESPIIPAGPKANFAANAVNGSIILSNLPQNVKIEVYNLQGKLISSKSLDQVNQSSGNMKIGVQAKGVYIIRVTAPGLNTSKAVSVW